MNIRPIIEGESPRKSVDWGRLFTGCALLGAFAAATLTTWLLLRTPPDKSIPATGGQTLTATNFPLEPYYLQTDSPWRDQTVGGSDEPLATVGCTVCCVSMALAQFGFDINPGILNSGLKQEGGYTRRGYLIWSTVSTLVSNKIEILTPDRLSHTLIDSSLREGNPVLAKVILWQSLPHWVLIVGKENNEYLIKNPLDKQRQIAKLSALAPRIESIRIVRPSPASRR